MCSASYDPQIEARSDRRFVGRSRILIVQKDHAQTDAFALVPDQIARATGFIRRNQHGPNPGTRRHSIKQKEAQLAAIGSLPGLNGSVGAAALSMGRADANEQQTREAGEG
jgi:hypothetical protein